MNQTQKYFLMTTLIAGALSACDNNLPPGLCPGRGQECGCISTDAKRPPVKAVAPVEASVVWGSDKACPVGAKCPVPAPKPAPKLMVDSVVFGSLTHRDPVPPTLPAPPPPAPKS